MIGVITEINGYEHSNVHFKWSPDNEPVAYIESGDYLKLSIPDASMGQIHRDSKLDNLIKLDFEKADGAVGPIYINRAEPGDTLMIYMDSIKVSDWGWSGIFKDFGLLDGFDDRLIIWKLSNDLAYSDDPEFLKEIRITINPFLGVVGTAPSEEEYTMIPPQFFGGNIDNRLFSKGSTLYLPVNVKGGLLSFGDPHAIQGDGEVSGTAIETSCECSVRITLLKRNISSPMIIGKLVETGNYVNTMGISDDLHKASQIAVRNMITLLGSVGYTNDEAYVLCSVLGKLKISEIVDMPNYVVTFSLCTDVFPEKVRKRLLLNSK